MTENPNGNDNIITQEADEMISALMDILYRDTLVRDSLETEKRENTEEQVKDD